MKPLALALLLLSAASAPAADTMAALVRALGETGDAQVQLDMLRGLRDATQGRPRLPMPPGWETVESLLARSANTEIRSLARTLGLTFGSQAALESLRSALKDATLDAAQRQDALRALAAVRDPGLPATLQSLLKDPALRAAAIRSLAGFDDPGTPAALLAVYASLAGSERRDTLATLAARPAYAGQLLAAVEAGSVPAKDLTAEVIRQLRSLKDESVNATLARVYGAVREVTADKQAEIDRYRRLYAAGGSTPGDAIRGRAAYAKVCQQCHLLFDVGGKVGPDLTGSNRGDLDYLLQNILDPNAVIPNEYRASTIDLKDGRVLTGIVKQQDDKTVTVATATETLTLARTEIAEITQGQLSMMPEGLVQPLADQEFRDLIYYLGRTGQTPLLATPDTANLFFNGRDLALWHGDDAVWSVEGGEIVGRPASGATGDALLVSDMIAADFRLVLQVRISPDPANRTSPAATLVFRAEPGPEGRVKGPGIQFGGATWGQLSLVAPSPSAEAPPSSPTPPPSARRGEWNTFELVVAGPEILTALNGVPGQRFARFAGARQGLIALALAGSPAGGNPTAAEVRFKDLRLEVGPSPASSTVKP
jgi:putative heme-binding domain-containing protein